MKLGELTWEAYKKGVCLRVLRLAYGIIEEQTERLEKFLAAPESAALGEDLQRTLQDKIKGLVKIISKFRTLPPEELLSLEIDELDIESVSRIKAAISEAAKRLRPLDQKGILKTSREEADKV